MQRFRLYVQLFVGHYTSIGDPDLVPATLKRRAAGEGMSLSDVGKDLSEDNHAIFP